MPRPGRRLVGFALCGALVGAVGCAPRVATLVQHKHYREAVCAAHDGGPTRRRLVAGALAGDTELYLHVAPVERDELAGIVGAAAAERVLERVQLVRITTRKNALPLDDFALTLTVKGDNDAAAAAPLGWQVLGVATGEKIPAQREYETRATIGNLLRVAGAVLTAGASLPFTRFKTRRWTGDAPRSEYERNMPIAAAMLDALGPVRCDPDRLRCTFHFVFDRSPDARWWLDAQATYVAESEPAGESCRLEHTVRVGLGRADEWGERFGPRMRRSDELGARTIATAWQRGEP